MLTQIARLLLPPRIYPRVRALYRDFVRGVGPHTPSGKATWEVYLNDPRLDGRLARMMHAYQESHPEVATSRYWTELNIKNVRQLVEHGYNNFKQTVALNYFTWLVGMDDPQTSYLCDNLPEASVRLAKERANRADRQPLFTPEQSFCHNFITFLLWEYTERQGLRDILDRLEEPVEGNPPSVCLEGKRISQDLANSVLEFQSISEGVGSGNPIDSVLELGAGYGRTANVCLSLLSNIRYVIADVPPALYISERYLSSQFPDRRIFRYRSFGDFSEVADEFGESQIAFLMPGQLKLLPDATVDLFLAIDCLHEMRPEQIEYYFGEVDRLAKRFYLKCWKDTTIPYDRVTITEADYPIRPYWKRAFWRGCKVQSRYFEAFFSLRDTDDG